MFRRFIALIALAVGLAGCATSPIPEGYTGPIATIRDSARSESGTRAIFFCASEIDSKRIETSLARTRSANYGRGFSLSPVTIERNVPAGKPMLVKLEGRTAYAAPIQEIIMAARMYSITELVEFEPKPDGRYVVRGELEEGKATIWLEDTVSGERVGKRVEQQ